MGTAAKDVTSEFESSELSVGENWKTNTDQVNILQQYVSELSEQNEILIQTIEDLERDNTVKVATLENRLQKTNVYLKEKSNKCDFLQQRIDSYNSQRNDSASHTQLLQEEVVQMGEDNSHYQTHIKKLEGDLEELITLIRKARTTGKWEISSVDLKAIPIESILDVETVVDPVPRSGTERITEYHLDELKEQLNARDKTIAMLELELNRKTKECHSIIDQARHCDEIIDSVKSDVMYLERGKQSDSGHLLEKDVLIRKLTNQLKNAEGKENNTQEYMIVIEDELNEVKNNNLILQNAIELRLVEIKQKDGTIDMLKKVKKQKGDAEDKVQQDVIREENEDIHFQLELANSKMSNLQEYCNELEKTHDSKATQHAENVKKLQVELKSNADKCIDFESKTQNLNNQLMKERNKVSNLECQLNSRIIKDDVNAKKDNERKEKALRLLEGQVKRLEEQHGEYENKLLLKDRSMERLHNQQKEYMDEVTKRDETVHQLELKLLRVEDELRKANNELEKSNKKKDSSCQELETLKSQYNQVVTEKGKLDAKVKAYEISKKSVHTTLSGEVTKQEEHIRNLLYEKSKLEDDLSKANDELESCNYQINDIEMKNKDLSKQVQLKELDVLNLESNVQELKFVKMQNSNKIEELEDEIREVMLKLESVERAKEQEKHKASLCEEQSEEYQSEIDILRNENCDLAKEISSKTVSIEQMSDELSRFKKMYQEKDKEHKELQDNLKKTEHQHTLLTYEVSSLKRDNNEDLQSRDHKIEMLQSDLEIANERYVQVNEELTAAEIEIQSTAKKYREISDMTDQLHKQIKQHNNEVQRLEMDLALTSEKHQTCVKENTLKDSAIIKLQSQLDTNQQELEYTVEELTQKSDRLDQVDKLLDTLREKCRTLQQSHDEDSKKIEENVEEINLLQMKNVELTREIQDKQQNYDFLEKEMTAYQEQYENKNRELETKYLVADEEMNMLKQEKSSLNYQINVLSEKNNEIMNSRNKEADDKQSALFKYEDLIEKYDELKNEKESETKKFSDKINTLEKELHASTLNASQLDGQLKLSNEKLKHCENQLLDEEKSSGLLGENVKSLETKICEKDEIIKTKLDWISQLENTNSDANRQIELKTAEIAHLNNDLLSHKEKISELTSQNKNCEEVIIEIREKLGNNVKENEHLNTVLSQLESEHKTLEEIHSRMQEELNTYESSNQELTQKNSELEIDINQKIGNIDRLECSVKELSEKLENTVLEKTQANEKILYLNTKFVTLKESVENDNLALLEENCVMKQELKELKDRFKNEVEEKTEEIKSMKDVTQDKIKENSSLEERTMKLSSALENTELELNQKSEELYNSEETINELHMQLQQFLEERKSMVTEASKQTVEINQLRSDLSDNRHQYKESAQQLAHYQEKCMLIERNLTVTQEQLSARITDNVKQEKLIRKAQNDNKYTLEDRKAKEVQVIQYEQIFEETHKELEKLKNENVEVLEENKAQRAALMTYECQLDASQKQTEQLLIEVENQKKVLSSSADSLSSVREKLHTNEIELETHLHELEENKRLLSLACDREEEIQRRLRDSESSNIQLHAELDTLIQKNRSCQEQISTYDAELRVLKADLEATQKKCSQQEKYITKTNYHAEKYQLEIQQCRDCSHVMKEKISELENVVEKFENELATVQANLDESVTQLTGKSNELSMVQSDMMAVQRLHTQSEQQLAIVDGKNKKLKTELKRSLDRIKSTADEIMQLTKTVSVCKAELKQITQQNQIKEEDIVKKDKELIKLRVDISSIEDKFKVQEEENDTLKNEMLNLNQRYHQTLEELEKTKHELKDMKSNGDRLTRESEQVVESMNNWVKEQREGNEKIATKVSEQNEKTVLLESANRKLTDDNEKLIQKTKAYKATLEEKRSESERHKKHQSQAAQQHVMIKQLKSNTEELEQIIEKERQENKESVGELQNRIKTNVETIQQLHRQLSELNKENLRQRSLLEKQTLSRKNLQAQLKSKENDIELLKDDINKSNGNSTNVSPGRNNRAGKVNVSSMLDKELERAGVSSEEALDKSYWIQRVGELSVQLQQSSDYWMQKLNSASQTNNSAYR